MNDFKKMNWPELQQRANRSHYTNPPVMRTQTLPQVAEDMTPEQQLAVSQRRYTFDGMASAFVWENRHKLRYVPQRSKWVYWDGHIWKWDDTGYARELVKAQGRALLTLPADDKDKKSLYTKWHDTLTMPRGIDSILNLAASDKMMVTNIGAFDADIYALNTPAGVVDLYTGKLSPATPENLVRRSTRIAPDANCPTPLYDRLLAEAFAGEPELSEYFDQMMGVSIIKAQDDQVFMYMYGAAGSGKGTLMNIALDILGKDEDGYAVNFDSSMFVKSRSTPHPTEYMQFLGARMAVSSEVTQGQKMDTGKLKKTTGGDPITGRYMGKDFVTFDATHTTWIMANDRLEVPHEDKGVWRRLKVIEFKHSRKSDDVIAGLPARIVQQEGPGILARWIARAEQYLTEGYEIPDTVIAAGQTYVAAQDTVSEWIESCLDTDEEVVSSFVSREALRDSYVNWCKRERKNPIASTPFTQALEAKGFTYSKQYVKHFDGTKKQMRGFMGLVIV